MADETGSATSIDNIFRAEAHGNAPAINIILGTEAIKPFAWFAGAVLAVSLLISLMALGVAIFIAGAAQTANAAAIARAEDKVSEANVNMRQLWYWNQMAYAQMEAVGIHLAPPPKPVTINPKLRSK